MARTAETSRAAKPDTCILTSPLTNLLAAARGAEKAMCEGSVIIRHALIKAYPDADWTWLSDIDAALTPLRKAIAEAEKVAALPFPQNPDSYEFDCVGCHRRLSMSVLAQDTPRTGMRCERCVLPASAPASAPTHVTPSADCQCGFCQADDDPGHDLVAIRRAIDAIGLQALHMPKGVLVAEVNRLTGRAFTYEQIAAAVQTPAPVADHATETILDRIDASRPPLLSLGQGAYRRDIDLQA